MVTGRCCVGPFEVESALKVSLLFPLSASNSLYLNDNFQEYLQTHPAVLESAAVGTPDIARGEAVKAFIILADEFKGHATGDKAKTLVADILVRTKRLVSPCLCFCLSSRRGARRRFSAESFPQDNRALQGAT